MKKLIVTTVILLFAVIAGQAQEKKKGLYSVAFYNLENLFDTIHDAGKNDYEYLPDAPKRWNTEKYVSKLKNLSKVISELSRDKVPEGPAVIGVAEAENRRVLDDLVGQPALASTGYRVVHYEGPDKRGLIVRCCMTRNNLQFHPASWFCRSLLRVIRYIKHVDFSS